MTRRTSHGLAFMACPIDDFAAFVAKLQTEEAADWHVVCFYPPPGPLPSRWRLTVMSRSLATASALWIEAVARRYVRVTVCCHDLAQTNALEPLLAFVGTIPCRERRAMDRCGTEQPIAGATPAGFARLLAVPVLLAISAWVTRLGLRVWRVDRAAAAFPAPGTAILIPILPDLSHTFVYREVLELKRRHPEYRIIALERGNRTVIHREATALLTQAEFVPHVDALSYLRKYVSSWIRRPAEMASLVRSFQGHTASFVPGWVQPDPRCFLRLEHLQHSNYLIPGLVLAWFLEENRIGYVHAYGSTYPALRALIAHRLLGIPFSVSTFVDFEYVTPFHLLDEKFGRARFIVACTEVCTARLNAITAGLRVRLLRHALPAGYADDPRFRPRDGGHRIVYIGRFVPKKGLDLLVRACALLAGRGVSFSAHLYGDGPERQPLATLIADLHQDSTIHLHPPVLNEDFYTVMNPDDVFVCASRCMPDGERDGIPVVLLEAMAAGIAVVSTSVSGIPELVVSGRNGWLVAPDDVPALAAAIERLLADAALRQRLGEAARQTIERDFKLETAVDSLDRWIIQESASAAGNAGPVTDHPHRAASASDA